MESSDAFFTTEAAAAPAPQSVHPPYASVGYGVRREAQQHISGFPPHSNSEPPRFYSAAVPPPYEQQRPRTAPYVYYPPIDESERMTPGKAALFVTVGGLLGLTAAAGVRWLNGGDFYLFPPALQQESALGLHIRGEEHHHSYEEPDVDVNEADEEQVSHEQVDRFSLQIESLVDALHSSTKQQEKLVQKLTSRVDYRGFHDTDHLKQQQSLSALFGKLSEVHAELSSLRRDIFSWRPTTDDLASKDTEKWESRLEDALKSIDMLRSNLRQEAIEQQPQPIEKIDSRSFSNTEESINPVDSPNDVDPEALSCSIRIFALENDMVSMRVGAQLLYLYVINVSSNPRVPRYRKIFTSNESFQRVSGLTGGIAILEAVGFVQRDGKWLEWQPQDGNPSDVFEDYYSDRLKEAAAALSILKSPPSGCSQQSLSEDAVAATRLSAGPCSRSETPPPDAFANGTPKQQKRIFSAPQTPEAGSILSPPATKKGPIMSPSSFPPLPPRLSKDDATVSFSDDSLLGDTLSSPAHHEEERRSHLRMRESIDEISHSEDSELSPDNVVDALWK